jgi:hypothetical protein
MQPISINTKIIDELVSNWANSKIQREFFKLTENLENFHTVFIDKNTAGSQWLKQFRKIRNNINDQNIRKLFDDLIGPRKIRYLPVEVNQSEDYLSEVTRKTPEKIGIDCKRNSFNDLDFFDVNTFNSHNYDSRNYLFRVPKPVKILPGCVFKDMRLFSPYIREANKIEFCDLFLFKNPQYEDDAEFIFCLLDLCKNIREIIIHCEPNPLNILQKKVETRLTKQFSKGVFKGFTKYKSGTKAVNHDRFIIVNHDKFSIRFTTSFNNLRKNANGYFEAKDSFLIEFSNGRNYFN